MHARMHAHNHTHLDAPHYISEIILNAMLNIILPHLMQIIVLSARARAQTDPCNPFQRHAGYHNI